MQDLDSDTSTTPPPPNDVAPRRRVDGRDTETPEIDPLHEAIAVVAARMLEDVVARAERDPELSRAVRTIAASLVDRLARTGGGREGSTSPATPPTRSDAFDDDVDPLRTPEAATLPPRPDLPRPDTVPVAEAAARLQIGLGSGGVAPESSTSSVESGSPAMRWPVVPDEELIEIERRCGIKARACRWCIERSGLLDRGEETAGEIESRNRDLLADAEEDGCRPWMLFEDPSCPTARLADYETLARCYDVLAEALSVVRMANAALNSADPEADPEVYRNLFRDSLHLLAESQSALRVAAGHIVEFDDDEQRDTFYWLRRTTSEQRIFVDRHMRANDPADPENSEEREERLRKLEEEVERRTSSKKMRRKRMGNLRHACRELRDSDPESGEHWIAKIVKLVDELVDDGDHPSSREIRELLLPVEEGLPGLDDVPDNVAQVLREVDKYLSTRPAPVVPKASEPSAEVLRVRELLRGKSVMLIGGQRRRQQAEALREAFELRELVWESTREHQSNDFFLPSIQRDDVAVVLLMIRWSSHSFGDVKQYCDAAGKPLVRLKAGYHPNQVAVQILEQCSDRLEPA